MRRHLQDAWHTLVPPAGDPHGPLAPLLVALTVVTGLVDAFSYLELGRVFVANMTGNVVFLGFALGGAPGFLWWASLLAIAAFFAGALAGGRLAHARGAHRGRHLLGASSAQAALTAVAMVVALVADRPYGDGAIAVLVALLGSAMGLQNATARALAVPDLTTTVLTLTITGISADSAAAGGASSRAGRRIVSIASMFAGALAGVALIEGGHGPLALVVTLALLVAIAAGAAGSARSDGEWVRPSP